MSIGTNNILLQGNLGGGFPLKPPKFYLLNRHSFGRLAHVGWGPKDKEDVGEVCGGVSIALNVNYKAPPEVFLYGLKHAITTLEEILLDEEINNRETLEEFTGHWRFTDLYRGRNGIALLEPLEVAYPIYASNFHGGYIYSFPDSPLNENYSLNPNSSRNVFTKSHRGLYVPIKKIIYPPVPGQSAHDWWVDVALKNIDQDTINLIKRFTNKPTNRGKRFTIIASILLGNSKHAWIGLDFVNSFKDTPHILTHPAKTSWKAIPFSPQIHSKEYLLPRGGANGDLSSNSVLIVGCGSVGSEISRQLAHSGIGRIGVVDFDVFDTDNIYRHTLNPKLVGTKKSEALKLELESKFPYLEVEVIQNNDQLNKLIDQGTDFSRYDGIVVATGDPTQERFFNETMRKQSKRPWIIYSWVEGFGVGGHCIYVDSNMNGCLECLYKCPKEEVPSLHNIQNFLSTNQSFAIDLSGCGTHFLPFSHLDAIQTATIATRAAIDAILGNFDASVRTSWKGRDTEAKENNLELTRRYYNYEESTKYKPLAWDGCPICEQ